MTKRKVCLDPGHYGSRYNAGVISGYYESAMTWQFTQYEKAELEKLGIDVVLTRNNIDENPSLSARGKMAKGCDLFVSNHSNAAGSSTVSRAVAIYMVDREESGVDEESKRFATMLAPRIEELMGVAGYQVYSKLASSDKDGNGKLDDNYYGVINGAWSVGVPGIIAEHSFHTNPYACQWLMDDNNLRELAKMEAKCIAEFLGVDNGVPDFESDTEADLCAVDLEGLTNDEKIEKIGRLCTEDMKKTGVLASVTLAQFILESGWGRSELAQNANNCFGMKCNLSGNTWSGSAWDGVSVYQKVTAEFKDGEYINITADFRKYPSINKSIADHSAYLLGAKKNNNLRYDGIKNERDYVKTITIIKNGGYATSPTYIEKVCNIIETYNLTRFDDVNALPVEDPKEPEVVKKLYRVRLTWEDAKSQLGAYANLQNAINKVDQNPGYAVFDSDGKKVYPEFQSYKVRVKVNDLCMRTGHTTDAAKIGFIPVGVYTIVDEKVGKVSSSGTKGTWGKLKSKQQYNGKLVDAWICLDFGYTEKV